MYHYKQSKIKPNFSLHISKHKQKTTVIHINSRYHQTKHIHAKKSQKTKKTKNKQVKKKTKENEKEK